MIWVKAQAEDLLLECSAIFRNECSLGVFSGEQWNTVGRYDTPEIAQDIVERVWRTIQSGGKALALPVNTDGSYTDKIDVTRLSDTVARNIYG
jgi:hypothetical protein